MTPRLKLFLFLSVMLAAGDAAAQMIDERVPVNGDSSKQWAISVKSSGMELLKGTAKTEGAVTEVTGYGRDLKQSDLVGAAALKSDGTVVSSPLHQFGSNPFDESPKQREARIAALRKEVQDRRTVLAELDAKLKTVNASKRQQAGFDEVDRVYDRLRQLEDQIAAAAE